MRDLKRIRLAADHIFSDDLRETVAFLLEQIDLRDEALKETSVRVDVMLTRGEFAEDPRDERITKRWLKRVKLAMRGRRASPNTQEEKQR